MREIQSPQTRMTSRDNTQDKLLVPIFELTVIEEEWQRQGPSFQDYRRVDITTVKPEGSTLVCEFDGYNAGYPHRKGHKLAIVPTIETELVVARVEAYDETVDPPMGESYYLVYIKGYGWWRFERNDAVRVKTSKPGDDVINKIVRSAVIW